MLTDAQVFLTALAICAAYGYVIWRSRRAHSLTRPTTTNDSVETSAFGQGTLFASRCLVATLIGRFGCIFWNDRGLISSPRTREYAGLWLVTVLALMGLSWYVLGLLMRSSARSLSYDNEGLWRTQAGKEQGLVRWGDICGVKELSSALALFDSDHRLLLKVEYERDDYLRIRTQIMERMSFRPPALPLVVSASRVNVPGWARLACACASLLFVGMAVLSSSTANAYTSVIALLCFAVLSGLMAIPRVKIVIGADAVRVGFREYSYSSIRSIEASFMRFRATLTPRLKLDINASRPAYIFTKNLPIDTLTLQRTLLWALSQAGKTH